jgi:hypothetical protein
VVVAGGPNPNPGDREFEICDLSGTPACASVGALNNPRCNAAAAVGNAGRVLIAGGDNCQSPFTALRTWDLVDTANSNAIVQDNGTTQLLASNGRRLHTATSIGSGKILLAGGGSGASADLFTDNATAASITVAATNAMQIVRARHSATLLAAGVTTACPAGSGCVLIAGGLLTGSSKTWEIFDGTSSFTLVGSATHELTVPARFRHVAAQFTNGKILLAGGTTNGTTGLTSTDVFDPAAGTLGFSAGLTLTLGRLQHAGAYASSQNVLAVFGGNTSLPWSEQIVTPP